MKCFSIVYYIVSFLTIFLCGGNLIMLRRRRGVKRSKTTLIKLSKLLYKNCQNISEMFFQKYCFWIVR